VKTQEESLKNVQNLVERTLSKFTNLRKVISKLGFAMSGRKEGRKEGKKVGSLLFERHIVEVKQYSSYV
jgi:hypothetical protein